MLYSARKPPFLNVGGVLLAVICQKNLLENVPSRYFLILRGVVEVTFYSKMLYSARKSPFLNVGGVLLAVICQKKLLKMTHSRYFLLLWRVPEKWSLEISFAICQKKLPKMVPYVYVLILRGGRQSYFLL